MAEIKVTLGCGARPRNGWIGLDIVEYGWNKVCDVTKDRFPFDDNTVDVVEMHNLIEHIERKHWRHMLNECWRVLKPAGIIEIITPDGKMDINYAMGDPTHVSFIVEGNRPYFEGRRPRNSSIGFKHWHVLEWAHSLSNEPRAFKIVMKPKK